MSTIISTENKNVEIVTEERTYKLEIHTPKGKDYWLSLYHETAETHDGNFARSEAKSNSPIVITMQSIFARQDSLTYTDLQGQEQTVKTQDVPLIVQAMCDIIRTENAE